MEQKTFFEKIRFDSNNYISDVPKAFEFLTSEKQNEEKQIIIEICLSIKEKIEVNRLNRNNRSALSEVDEAYQEYKNLPLARTIVLSKSEFTKIYRAVVCIELDGMDIEISKQAQKAATELQSINRPKEKLIEILDLLIETSPEYTASVFSNDNDDFIAMSDILTSVYKKIRHNKKYWLDTLCALTYELDYNDIDVESKYIFYKFTSRIDPDKSTTASIIEPSLFFMRKWLLDSNLVNAETTFVFMNNHVCNICRKSMNHSHYNNISIITLAEYYEELEKGSDEMILIMGNNMDSAERKGKILQSIKENIRSEHYVCVLDSDSNVLRASNPIHQELIGQSIECIDLLPAGINNCTHPQRKAYITSVMGYTAIAPIIKVNYLRLFKDSDFQGISRKPYSLSIQKVDFDAAPETLRQKFRSYEEDYRKKTNQKRKAAEIVPFSPEISIAYNTFAQNDKSDVVRVRAVMRVLNKKTNKWVTVPGTKKEKRSIPSAQIENWLKNEYPYDNVIKVQKAVSDTIERMYLGRPLSIKSCVYSYMDYGDKIAKGESDYLRSIADSDLGEMRLDRISTERLDDYLVSFSEKDYDISLVRVLRILEDVFDCGIKRSHCRYNPVLSIDPVKKERYEELSEVRSAVGKRFLTLDEIRAIVRKCRWEIKEGHTQYIAVLIRLLTGLETDIIAALTWRDFIVTKDGEKELFQLRVEKQISRDKKVIPFQRKEHVRTIPLTSLLVKILVNERHRISAELSEDDGSTLMDKAIIEGKTAVSLTTWIMPPETLNNLCRQLVRDLNITEERIVIPENEYGVLNTDLNSYKGDLYKNSFRHYLVREARPDLGDLNYLLGVVAPNTVYKSYIGCDSFRIQERLLKALQKVEDCYLKEESHG